MPEFLNPVPIVAALHGRFFVNHPRLGYALAVSIGAVVGVAIWRGLLYRLDRAAPTFPPPTTPPPAIKVGRNSVVSINQQGGVTVGKSSGRK